MPVELTGLFTMMLGVWYPRNYVVAAIDPKDGETAVRALGQAGFGSQAVRYETGAKVLDIRKEIEAQRGPLARAAARASHALTDEGLMSQQYFDEAAAGASIIAVLAPEAPQAKTVAQVLSVHHARHIRFYGDKTITDL